MNQKQAVNQNLMSTLLSFVKAGGVAVPEIQRHFVWASTNVRNRVAMKRKEFYSSPLLG